MPNSPEISLSQPLLRALKNKVLPWAEQWGMQRVLLVPHDISDAPTLKKWLATGATLTPRPFQGRRVSVKGPREISNRSSKTALWPNDNLQSLRIPLFVCVLRGEADFQVGEHLLHCKEGHMLLIQPDVPQPDGTAPHLGPEHRADGFCDLLWLSPAVGAGIGCWICCSQGDRHFERPDESCYIPDALTAQIFDSLTQEASGSRSRHRAICEALLQAMLAAVARELEEGRLFQFPYQKTGLSHEIPHLSVQNLIPSAQQYIKSHLHQPLHIEDVTRAFFVSRSEFTRRFRLETGQSFHQYLTQARLNEAQHLLRSTNWSVARISEVVGFRSSRLRVLFNQHGGGSPQRFRELARQELAAQSAVRSKRVNSSQSRR